MPLPSSLVASNLFVYIIILIIYLHYHLNSFQYVNILATVKIEKQQFCFWLYDQNAKAN